MDYWRFAPDPCRFPAPHLPMLPPFSLRSLLPHGQPAGDFRLLDESRNALFFTRARYALLEAYRHAGLGPQGALLAPAYHCRTMLDPAIHLGAPVLLYSVNSGLQPELESLEQSIRQSPYRIKALLAPHFFGFAQQMDALRDLTRSYEIDLIEDCSHLLILGADRSHSQPHSSAIGRVGRWSVASPYKFFACHDGGLLWSADQDQLPKIRHRASRGREWRRLFSAVQAARHSATVAGVMPCDSFDLSPEMGSVPEGCDGTLSDSHVSPAFNPDEAQLRGAPWARKAMLNSDVQRLAERRRQHYGRLLDAVSTLPNCKPLYSALDAQTVPYMFPLYIEHPLPHFFFLKRLGVPVGRWDELAVSNCRIASDYRLRLIHLPCHQGLSDAQVEWMCRALSLALNQAVKPT